MDYQGARAYVLNAYPVSSGFRDKIEGIAGPGAVFLSVSELRAKGWKMIAFLRGLNSGVSFYIALEDPQSESLLGLLLAITFLSSVRDIAVIDSRCCVRRITRGQAARSVAQAVLATMAGALALLRSYAAVALPSLYRPGKRLQLGSGRRILYLNSVYWFGLRVGGSVGHIAGVANALADEGYELHFASAAPQPMLRPSVRNIRIKGLAVQCYPQVLSFLRFHYHLVRQLRSLGKNRYRFLYHRMTTMNFTGVVLSRIWHIPLVLEYNGSEVWCAENWGRGMWFSSLGRSLERLCLRHAYRVVVVSQPLADEVIENGVDPTRVVCYPNCVDPSHFNPEAISQTASAAVRERYGISPDETVISFVGTFGRWHGAPVLAEAIRNLADRDLAWLERNKVRFAMIGDGSTMPAVRSLIGGSEYARWVVFTGLVPQNETVNYLAASDILVSPHVANADGSRFFGSPTKLFEYMAMGKGIIASDLDQIGEVLAKGIRIGSGDPDSRPSAPAILVRPGNLDDLERAIRLLVENPTLRRAIGTSARAELLRKYTWRHHVDHILESLEGHQVRDVFPETEGSVVIS